MSKENLNNKNHTSHIALHTSNKGITLIALIITIIVMLILTGVTLSVVLGDNGLVNKSKEAKLQMEIEQDRELLLSAVIGAIGIDGKVNFSSIVLPEGFTGSNGNYTSKNGHSFAVTQNGEVVYLEKLSGTQESDLELLRRYFLGEIDETTGERPGIDLLSLIDNLDSLEGPEEWCNIKFKENGIIPNINDSIEIIAFSDIETSLRCKIKYNNCLYNIEALYIEDGDDYFVIGQSVQLLQITNPNIDLSGTYYGHYDAYFNINSFNEYYIIEDNVFIDSIGDDTDYIYNIKYMLFDEENQIVEIIIEEHSWSQCFEYELIYEDNDVVNILLREVYSEDLLWQNYNGLETDLEGTYIEETTSDNPRKISFSGNLLISNDNGGATGYFKYKGVYYLNGRTGNLQVSEDKKTIIYYGTTYIRQED